MVLLQHNGWANHVLIPLLFLCVYTAAINSHGTRADHTEDLLLIVTPGLIIAVVALYYARTTTIVCVCVCMLLL